MVAASNKEATGTVHYFEVTNLFDLQLNASLKVFYFVEGGNQIESIIKKS